MNKSELIEELAKRAELTKAAANRVIDHVTDIITTAISKGNPVALIGFGTFKSVMRSARTGKNPKTGAPLKIAARTVPKFSAGAALKAAVSGKKVAAKKPAAKPAVVSAPVSKKKSIVKKSKGSAKQRQ